MRAAAEVAEGQRQRRVAEVGSNAPHGRLRVGRCTHRPLLPRENVVHWVEYAQRAAGVTVEGPVGHQEAEVGCVAEGERRLALDRVRQSNPELRALGASRASGWCEKGACGVERAGWKRSALRTLSGTLAGVTAVRICQRRRWPTSLPTRYLLSSEPGFQPLPPQGLERVVDEKGGVASAR